MGDPSSPRPPDVSERPAVRFLHLLCAARHRVESPIAEAICIDTAEGWRWLVRSIRPQSRNQFRKSMAFTLEAFSNMHQQPLGEEAVAKLIGPMQRRLEPGESTSPFDSHCVKCGLVLTTTPAGLVAGAMNHGGRDRLYLADRGEVVSRLDGYAQQLAIRDRRAQQAARQRLAAIAAQGVKQAAFVSLWQSLSPPMRRALVSLGDPRTDDPMIGLLAHELAGWSRRHPEPARLLGLPPPPAPVAFAGLQR